ncbi:MAG: hypothetical protein QOI41_2369 [Myxococcales bacterium]|nr:hypothetical protein [Myxococcales bacterium]
MPRAELFRRAALVVVLACLACLACFTIVACRRDVATETLPGVRLGMAPRDVRDRFDGGGEGSWQTKVGGGQGASDDTVVEWNATADQSRVSHARFEFHLGMLVAVRAHVRDAMGEPRIEATPKTVTVVTPAAGGTDVTLLARDCPTHHEEAESLAAKAR